MGRGPKNDVWQGNANHIQYEWLWKFDHLLNFMLWSFFGPMNHLNHRLCGARLRPIQAWSWNTWKFNVVLHFIWVVIYFYLLVVKHGGYLWVTPDFSSTHQVAFRWYILANPEESPTWNPSDLSARLSGQSMFAPPDLHQAFEQRPVKADFLRLVDNPSNAAQ